MQSGELIVAGKDHIRIELHHFPKVVCVEFKGCIVVPPCTPQHDDSLEYEVRSTIYGTHVLLIKWDVSNVREIVWSTRDHHDY